MTDEQIIEDLAGKVGGVKALAAELNITRQTVWDWRTNGISFMGRFLISAWAKQKRHKLPENFMGDK